MSRDLTDLMERATAFAPPEPHPADEITQVAVRRHRRRTNGIIGGACAAVLVVAGLAYGVTRHDSKPQPAAPYKHNQQVDVSDAVAGSVLPGFEREPWTIPSVQEFGPRTFPWATYHDVDADGRLIVLDYPSGEPQSSRRVRLFDGPGESARPLDVPPSPGTNSGHRISWMPSFLDDGHLLWTADTPIVQTAKEGFHITDLSGGDDVFVHSGFTVGKTGFEGTPGNGRPGGISGDGMWFLVYEHNPANIEGAAAFDLYTATFDGDLTEVAEEVADLAVGDGMVAWVTTSGRLMTQSATGGSPQAVDVPLDAGCRLPTQLMQSFSRMFAVSGSAISVTEECGKGKSATYALVGFDLSGRRLVRIAGPIPSDVSIAGDSLLFVAGNDGTFRYDFVTGTLARLGDTPRRGQASAAPRGAGDYVLWYDRDGGHVARIPQ